MNIIEAIRDPELFGPFFGDSFDTWKSWFTALRVLHGLPVNSKRSRKLIRQCTGRDPREIQKGGYSTFLGLCGRRSGKSRCIAAVAGFASVLAGLEKRLAKGEVGLVPVICPTKSQGRIIKNYLRAIFEAPRLHRLIESEDRHSFTLKSGVRIEILPGDFRHVRGYTLLAAICDEIAFFGLSEESRVRSDTELISALQPALATTQGRLICIGSPYARKGWCWNQYKKHWGNDKSQVLVWNAPSRVMNPTLPQSVVDAAMEEDRAAALSEYMGEFRDDVGIFIPREVIDALVVSGRQELLPEAGIRYSAFCDISGGRSDGSALAIGHRKGRITVVDFAKLWRSPAKPHEVIADMANELKRFGLKRVTGDQYGAEFCVGSFQSNGIKYEKAEKPKSQLYAELLPVLCSGEIELLDNETLLKQLAGLERRTRSGGKDVIDHAPGAHDDLANAVAGLVVESNVKRYTVGGLGEKPKKKGSDDMNPRNRKQRDDGELVCPSNDPAIKKFFAEHGKFVFIGPHGREVIFRDGSAISYSAAACGWETPVDADELSKLERAQNKVRYWQKVAEDATKAFRNLKKYYEVDLPSHMEIDDDDTAKLIALRDQARHARAKLRKAQATVKDEQPFHLRKREQLRIQRQKELAQHRRRISAIQD